MKKKFLIFFLLGLFLVTPLIGLAQFKLQQTYPSVGGSQLSQDVAASQSIPTLIKFLFNLVVWLCILAAVIVLIIGGVQYVASTGDVSKMTGAKTRIYSSLLGLTILIGAWFVLHTMDPSLVIPKITYEPIKQGIILFTHNGYCRFTGNYGSNCGIVKDKNVDESIINDLIQGGEAFRLNYDLPDLTKEFGELVWYDEDKKKLNFENFELYAIGFWGTRESQSIVAFYPQKNYLNKAYYFSTLGAVTKEGKPCDGNGVGKTNCDEKKPDNNSNIKGFQLVEVTSGIKAPVEYFDVYKLVDDKINPVLVYSDQRQTYLKSHIDSMKQSDGSLMGHPPMSLKIIRSGPGVYLADANGNERYFDEPARNFKDPSINFNQLAKTIKIVNDIPERKYTGSDGVEQVIPAETHDFLVILHQGDNFSGNLKIYFEGRNYEKNNTNPTIDNLDKTSKKAVGKSLPAYTYGGNPGLGLDGKVPSTSFFEDTGFKFSYYRAKAFGHLPTITWKTDSTNFDPVDNTEVITNIAKHEIKFDGNTDNHETYYGQIVSSISSLQLFELADDQAVCQEVRLCTEKNGQGYCIAYVIKDSAKKEEPMVVFYPMPVYLPVNIPCPSMWLDLGCKKPTFNLLGINKEIDFNNHIKSISITGKCAVFLAQNDLDYGVGSMWASGVGPGGRSEIFTQSDGNLEDNEIGLCGSVGVFNRQIGRECASAIAVYPIK